MNKNDILQMINDSDFGQKMAGIQYRMTHRPRSKKELEKYLEEAWDKVWLMRSSPVEDEKIEKERAAAVDRILETYDDIPAGGYDSWERGFWMGVLGTLRWCLGEEEKDWLDT
jgi:hypothetical protein